jgi:hypothetical protein
VKIQRNGQVRRIKEPQKLAVANDELVFPDLAQATMPVAGNSGTVTLKAPPASPYTTGERVLYEDGNANNTVDFVVSAVVGPSKYRLTVV